MRTIFPELGNNMTSKIVVAVLFGICFLGVGFHAANQSLAEEVAIPGFVPGDTQPDTNPPAVRYKDGWLVPYEETIPGSDVTFQMVPVPGGSFLLGSPGDEVGREDTEGPQVEVAVSPFWMGACEVTWEEYKVFMSMLDLFTALESSGVRLVTEENEVDAVTAPSALYDPTTTFINGEEPQQPAVTMTQYSARQYTKWLTGLTGRFYRLPAESEWEYACRAGTKSPFSFSDTDSFGDYAWFVDNSDDTTHPVGEKKSNPWGLFDMHGNVSEWVIDEMTEDGYANVAALPQPVTAEDSIRWPTDLESRVVRGGAYFDEPSQCRSAARRGSEDEAWKDVDPNLPKSPFWYTEEPALGIGMRLVRPVDIPSTTEEKSQWWKADVESIEFDVNDRVSQGRGARGIADESLPKEAKELGFAN